ncbi:hypothetical protein [Psittacicella melopsittaci]|uniref:hypothetical protein n=1 Tax=Psittacicella melopsittaci TaxID=2028576 RepID=UPI0011C499F4|nr:hypothetical protein [Psittacicella melopsittaci]
MSSPLNVELVRSTLLPVTFKLDAPVAVVPVTVTLPPSAITLTLALVSGVAEILTLSRTVSLPLTTTALFSVLEGVKLELVTVALSEASTVTGV